jgi:hypothetical protein
MNVTEPSLPHLQVDLKFHHLAQQPSSVAVAVSEMFLKERLVAFQAFYISTNFHPCSLQLLIRIRLVSLFAQTTQHFMWWTAILPSTQVSYVKIVRRTFQKILLHWNHPCLHVVHLDTTNEAPRTEWCRYTYCIWCGTNYCLIRDDHVTEFNHYILIPRNNPSKSDWR